MSSGVDVVLRDARPADRDVIHELTLSAYAQYAEIMAPSAWAGLRNAILAALSAESDAQRIVAESDGRVIGSVLLFPASTDAYLGIGTRAHRPELRLLAVAPEARGLGVARLLVAECIRRARATGAEAIGLHTSRSMREAIRLYLQAGFVRDPEHDITLEGAEPIEAYRLALS